MSSLYFIFGLFIGVALVVYELCSNDTKKDSIKIKE